MRCHGMYRKIKLENKRSYLSFATENSRYKQIPYLERDLPQWSVNIEEKATRGGGAFEVKRSS